MKIKAAPHSVVAPDPSVVGYRLRANGKRARLATEEQRQDGGHKKGLMDLAVWFERGSVVLAIHQSQSSWRHKSGALLLVGGENQNWCCSVEMGCHLSTPAPGPFILGC
ncbi:hypothetical protein CLAIMM_01363 [Cladophialophora immunda]|nr:hypothetical protein CLAIMM_01363 [Cladophialophora immunda]